MGGGGSKKSREELEMSAGVQRIKSLISTKKVVVVSKSWCGFCKTAKRVLSKYNIAADNIEVVEIDGLDDCDDIQDYMREITGGRSVPRVFIQGNFIGGGDETAALDRQGKLKQMLQDADAI